MTIYKIAEAGEWRAAERLGVYQGAAVDRDDGFIHFSTREQLAETASRHFAGRADCLLLAVDEDRLGPGLRMEPSRGGALFPHLYGPLPVTAVERVAPFRPGPDGRHVFPWDD